LGENRTLQAVAMIGLIALTGCTQTLVNPPSANAPSECADLTAEQSRRSFAYNVKTQAIREERARTGQAPGLFCLEPNRMRERIAELSAIVAVSDKMNAKGCYQQPIGEYNRKLLDVLKTQLARCQGQAAPTGPRT
jgi:hypothetical protein